MSDRDTLTDFEDAYSHADSVWSPWTTEVLDDFRKYLGDQTSWQEKAYLNEQRRNILHFNKIRRVIQLVTGYERKHRLSLKIDPVEGGDPYTAEQMSAIVMHLMTFNKGYNVCSECFEQGPLKSGLTLLNLYNDYSEDPISGDIKFKRVPFTKFKLDPNFSEQDLSDCGYILRREWPTVKGAQMLLPSHAKEIGRIAPSGRDGKFNDAWPAQDTLMKNRLRYDEFWRPDTEQITAIMDTKTEQWRPWNGDKERLRLLMQMNPQLREFKTTKKIMKLSIMVEGQLFYSDKDPLGIDEYPFIAYLGFFDPEFTDLKQKLQGLVRCMKDPQTEYNRRVSKMLDILDSQISSGHFAEEDTVVNPADLYQTGQGKTIWLKKGVIAEGRQPKEKRAPDVPQGIFQMSQLMDKEILEIPGANFDMMGMAGPGEERVAASLSHLRSAQGLTVLQKLFDNQRLSKSLLGNKLVKIVQKNYKPSKVARIVGQQPTKQFYEPGLAKYDCVPAEGLLTDTQRQLYYQQLLELKKLGAPIPWAAVLEVAPVEQASKLRDALKNAEQGQQKAQQIEAEDRHLLNQLLAAKSAEDISDAQANKAKATLDMAKTMSEISAIPQDQLMESLKLLIQLQGLQNQGAQNANRDRGTTERVGQGPSGPNGNNSRQEAARPQLLHPSA